MESIFEVRLQIRRKGRGSPSLFSNLRLIGVRRVLDMSITGFWAVKSIFEARRRILVAKYQK